MPQKQYTYFDICKALFGTNTDAFGIEAIHDFIVKGLKSRKPYCLYYGDFAIEINRSFDSVIDSFRREFDKTFIEVNLAYDIIRNVAKSNAFFYTSTVDNILKSGDKSAVLRITTTKRGIDSTETFIKADLLPGFVVNGYSKIQQAKQQSGKNPFSTYEAVTRKHFEELYMPMDIELDAERIKQLMMEKSSIQPDSLYDEYIKTWLSSVVRQEFAQSDKVYVDTKRNSVIVRGDDKRDANIWLDRLITKLVNRFCEEYMPCEVLYAKMQNMPVFAKRFSFNEVLDTLSKSAAFQNMGFVAQREIDGKKIYSYYLKNTEFEAFLEDEYPELYEQYTWRKEPWISVENLTRISKLSEFTIRDVLAEMESRNDALASLIRYETRAGEKKPFLNKEGLEIFLESAKVYKARQKQEQERKKYIKQYWLKAEDIAKCCEMSVDIVRDVLTEMSKNIMYTIMVKVLEENGSDVLYLAPSSIPDFQNYVKYHYKGKSAEAETKPIEPVAEKPMFVPEQKPAQICVIGPGKPQMPHIIKPEKPCCVIPPVRPGKPAKESFYVNGASREVYLPDIHIMNQSMLSASRYINVEDLEVLGTANALANSKLYDENGTLQNFSPKVSSVAGIIKTYLKNVRNYYKEKEGQITDAREKIFIRCIMGGVDTLDKEAVFIKNNFNIDVRPLVARYRNGEFPTLDEVYKVFLNTEFNAFCVRQLSGLIR